MRLAQLRVAGTIIAALTTTSGLFLVGVPANAEPLPPTDHYYWDSTTLVHTPTLNGISFSFEPGGRTSLFHSTVTRILFT